MFIPNTHKVDIYDLVTTAGKEQYSVSAVHTGFDMGIYPAGVDIQAVYPSIPSYQLYEGISEELPTVKNGSKLKSDLTGEEWIVRGTPQIFRLPLLTYQRVTLEKII